jgi:hypothetical protein
VEKETDSSWTGRIEFLVDSVLRPRKVWCDTRNGLKLLKAFDASRPVSTADFTQAEMACSLLDASEVAQRLEQWRRV